MMRRDLRLPDGRILQLGTDKIISEREAQFPLNWDGINSLAGDGSINGFTGTKQPYLGCPTGGDVVAEILMSQLAEEYAINRIEGDNDARWSAMGSKRFSYR